MSDAGGGTARRLGVLGWPVAHSRSPTMQNAALEAVGLRDWRYQLLPVPPELFEETVRGLPAVGFRGANVTIPHKAAALALASSASPRARAIGAANTLLFEPDGQIVADNTDAPGLIDALAARGVLGEGTSAMLLGAGGTARAALWALRDAGVRVSVWNRTRSRAQALCADLGGEVVDEPVAADLLIQTTAAGLAGEGLPPFPALESLAGYRAVVDFVYTDGGSALVAAAETRGLETVDGLELLVRQGARSFEQFTGVAAPVRAMGESLNIRLGPDVRSG